MKIQSENGFTLLHFQMLINILLVSVMLACFSAMIGRVIIIYYPMWEAYWFPILTFMITLVTMLTRYVRRFSYESQLNPISLPFVEAILIMLLAKVVSILITVPLNWISIWREVASWGQNFFENFTDVDFLLRVFGLLLMWLFTWLFSSPLNQLQDDEVLLEQEKLGYTFNDRNIARRKLIGLVLNIGIVMIIIMVIQNSDLHSFPKDNASKLNSLVILIIYFFTAFTFLAHNQYAIMKARWYFNNITIKPDFIKRWMLFSVFFILAAIVLFGFLPTNFSLEIPELGQWLIQTIITIMSYMISIVLAPFILIGMLIEGLSKGEPLNEPLQELIPEIPAMLPQTISVTPWWDVLKSIIFWLVFIVVIVTAISYYLINHPNLKGFLHDSKLIGWFYDLWKLLLQSLKQAQKAAAETIQIGVGKIQTFIKKQHITKPGVFKFAQRLSPREAIILIYTDWIEWNQKHGIQRNSAQTPLEYAQNLKRLQQDENDWHISIVKLTDVFIQARYSTHSIVDTQVTEAQLLVDHLKKDLLGQLDQQVSAS